jgi:hypothetical protein
MDALIESIVSAGRVGPDRNQIEKRLRSVPHAHLGPFDIIPPNGHLDSVKAQLASDKQNFRVETEAFQLLTGEDRLGRIAAEKFESALSVVDVEAKRQAHEKVEDLACTFPKLRLVNADQRAVESARANGYRRGIANGGVKIVKFFDRS